MRRNPFRVGKCFATLPRVGAGSANPGLEDAIPLGLKTVNASFSLLASVLLFGLLFAASAFAQVTNLNLGNLAPGESITVVYEVTINNSLPPTLQGITNQAAVSATGLAAVNSDDPDTVALNDPTVTPLVQAPIVTTTAASGVGAASATLNGTVNPQGDVTGYYFEYGTNINFASSTATNLLSASYVAGPVNAVVNNLLPNTVYQFRAVATNSMGLVSASFLSFTTAVFAITAQPTNVNACLLTTASFSVGVNVPGIATYQWQRRAPGAGVFISVIGATNSSFSTPPVTAADDGTGYRVIVSAPGTNATSSEALLTVISVPMPAVTYNFNSGLPPNTAIYGNAYISNGILELNTNTANQNGSFLTADLAPGRLVRGFSAFFRVEIVAGVGSPFADGFSFNWATDLPNGVFIGGEQGEGSGLRVCFDTFDNVGEAPAIDVKWGTNLVGHYLTDNNFLPGISRPKHVYIRLNADGTLDLTFDCRAIFTRLPIPGYTPLRNARFGLGSRTGGFYESHSIDDLALQLVVDPTNGVPLITRVATNTPSGLNITGTASPNQNVSVEASQDFSNWVWRATIAANGAGVWNYFEPNIVTPPYRFYRAVTAPQFPAGLVNWWRAESNYVDSIGAIPGTPLNGLGFTNGQRGLAFNFNGVNQAMHLGGAALPVPWTACFWVRRTNANDVSAALISDANTAIKLEQSISTRRVGLTVFGGTDFLYNTITPTNTWVHLGFVGTATGTILYVNGVAAETNAATINLPRFTLGASFNGTGDRMKGQLDETVLFNRALTPPEVQQVYNATRGP